MTDSPADLARRARSFGPAAERYDRWRPRYPAEALRWVLGDRSRQVADLGAGTGILSRGLAALGHQVVPVEPDEAMRERLAAASPGLTPLAGTAERIPLPDASMDAVVAGQAYHWFDPEPAHAEIARVLRPGGVFGPVWNERDESVDWAAALSALAEGAEGRGIREPVPAVRSFGPRFGPVSKATFRHEVTHTPDTLVGLVTTRSYYLVATEERQRELVAQIRELCASHPELAGRERFPVPYRTVGYRATRSES